MFLKNNIILGLIIDFEHVRLNFYNYIYLTNSCKFDINKIYLNNLKIF